MIILQHKIVIKRLPQHHQKNNLFCNEIIMHVVVVDGGMEDEKITLLCNNIM